MTTTKYDAAIVSFDKYISDLRFNTVAYDQHRQCYEIDVELVDLDEVFLFCTENDRMMRLLVPQQFKVRLNNRYYEVDSVDYEPVGHVTLKVFAFEGDIRSAAVHINLSYFQNDRRPWEVPHCTKIAFADDGEHR
jgi:hypothetical protein